MEAIYLRRRISEEMDRAAKATDPRARAAHLGLVQGYLALLERRREVMPGKASPKIAEKVEALL